MAEICQEKHIDMDLIVRPEKYRDAVSVTRRLSALREAHRLGVAIGSLQTLCPMSERRIRMVVIDTNQKALDLGIKEAEREKNGSGTDSATLTPTKTESPLGPVPTSQRAS